MAWQLDCPDPLGSAAHELLHQFLGDPLQQTPRQSPRFQPGFDWPWKLQRWLHPRGCPHSEHYASHCAMWSSPVSLSPGVFELTTCNNWWNWESPIDFAQYVALLGNGLIISAVACGHHLHTPMFFFLLNLALSDLGSICTTVPKAMHNSLWDTRNISYTGCAAQLFFFMFFIGAEFYLLTVMCYDRYVSICKPLHYGTLLGSRACAHMAAAAWASDFLTALMHTANAFSLALCHGNALGQFFCEIPQILKLSCSKSYLREFGLLAVSACLSFGCFMFIVFSYVQIFRAVLRIPSEQGRHKAFSTCLPHPAVLSLFLSTGTFAYLKPPSMSSPSLDVAVTVLYSVIPAPPRSLSAKPRLLYPSPPPAD
ncbi:olfactory receptor 14A16-like [Melospiza melodia melodia]|uniref:olfactory receptor 14A16-like n=1 Tax=Melospiza melodia melodia TaxID=1914991 RepID=UPI002FD552B5